MNKSGYILKLEKLASRFHIYCTVSPTSPIIIDVYDIDKYGNPIASTLRRYRGESLKKATIKAYYLEFENKMIQSDTLVSEN